MSPKLKKYLQYSVFFAIGISLMVWQFQKMSAEEKDTFTKSVQSAKLVYLIPIVIMSLLSHWSRAYRWRFLIEPMGYQVKQSNAFATVMIGYLVNTLLPRAGEVAKCGLLGKREKIPTEKLIGTIIIERAIDLVCYAILIVITIILQYNRIKNFVQEKYQTALANSAIHPGIKYSLILASIIGLVFLFKWLYKKNRNFKIFAKINNSIQGLSEGMQSIKKLRNPKAFWLHTLLIWTMYLLQIYVGFSAMEFTKGYGLDAAAAILTMGTLAMILTPGGIGAFPVAVAEVLLLFGASLPLGSAFGWVIWGVSTAIVIIVGILCAVWFEKNKLKQLNEVQ
jgi:glycosyltransferase 2 family protein